MRNVVLLACLCACTLAANAEPGDWTPVQGLAPGTVVKVRADHNSSTCSVSTVTADTLVCRDGAESRSYPRGEVRRVSLSARGKSTLRGALIGAGVGGATGLIVGAASTTGGNGWLSVRKDLIEAMGGIGLAAGTTTGAVVGDVRNSSGHVIYKR